MAENNNKVMGGLPEAYPFNDTSNCSAQRKVHRVLMTTIDAFMSRAQSILGAQIESERRVACGITILRDELMRKIECRTYELMQIENGTERELHDSYQSVISTLCGRVYGVLETFIDPELVVATKALIGRKVYQDEISDIRALTEILSIKS
jgi:hypothetical protein